jgi:hypothetical protein
VAKRLAKTVSAMYWRGEEISPIIAGYHSPSTITFVRGRNSEMSSFGYSNDGHPTSKREMKQQEEINMNLMKCTRMVLEDY